MKKELALGAVVLLLSNVLSRILGLARDAYLAHTSGLGIDVDAYNLAFLLPDLINHVLGAGLLPVTLIPLLTLALKEGRMDEVSQRVSRLLNLFAAVVVVLCLVGMWQIENLLPLLTHKPLSPELVSLTAHYARILLFAQIFFVIGGFCNAVQYGAFRYVLPAMAPLVYNGSIILGGLVHPGGTVEGYCWGVLIGAAIGPCVFQCIGAYKQGFRWRMVWEPFHPEVWRFAWKTLPFLCGVGAVFGNELAYRVFGLSETGSVAALGFGLRISMALSVVLGGAVGIAVYPWFARLCAEGQQSEVSRSLGDLLEKMLVVLVPALVLVFVFAESVVTVYLGGGAFGSQAVQMVAYLLQLYLLQVLPMTALLLISRSFYADQQTWLPSIVTLACFGLSFPFYIVFESFGSARIPIIGALTTLVQVVVLLGFWLRRYPGLERRRLVLGSAKILIVTALLAPVLWYVSTAVQSLDGRLLKGLALAFLFSALLPLQWLLYVVCRVQAARQFAGSILQRVRPR